MLTSLRSLAFRAERGAHPIKAGTHDIRGLPTTGSRRSGVFAIKRVRGGDNVSEDADGRAAAFSGPEQPPTKRRQRVEHSMNWIKSIVERSSASALLVLTLVAAHSTSAAASELVLEASTRHVLDATINGYRVRLRVDPETPGYIVLNPDTAFRLLLRSPVAPARAVIGPVRLNGYVRGASLGVGNSSADRRVMWTNRRAVDGADGLVGPADLPFDRVTMRLRPAAAGEHMLELPMAFDRAFGLFHRVQIADQPLQIRISTVRRESLATAAAGALLAAELEGRWTGASRNQLIKYGIMRPVRPMAVAIPFGLGHVPLHSFLVRGVGNAAQVGGDQAAGIDVDELVVTGSRQLPPYNISFGLDWLSACSSVTWDNRTRRMLISCRGSV